MMNKFVAKLVGVALLAGVPLAPALSQAPAQAPSAIAVGMPVVDASGASVGTISSMQGTNVTVKTDRHEVPLSATSFAVRDGKAYFGMTQAQLNAEYEKAIAAAQASLAAGATVVGLQGTPLGVIEALDGQNATIKLSSGKSVTLARSGLRGNADGTVTIGLTAEQLEAAVEQAAGNGAAQ